MYIAQVFHYWICLLPGNKTNEKLQREQIDVVGICFQPSLLSSSILLYSMRNVVNSSHKRFSLQKLCQQEGIHEGLTSCFSSSLPFLIVCLLFFPSFPCLSFLKASFLFIVSVFVFPVVVCLFVLQDLMNKTLMTEQRPWGGRDEPTDSYQCLKLPR